MVLCIFTVFVALSFNGSNGTEQAYLSGAMRTGALRSLSCCRSFGEAVMPSAPVGRYPATATSVEGVPLTTTFRSASIWRTLGEAVTPSRPGVR